MIATDELQVQVSIPAGLYHKVVRPLLEYFGSGGAECEPPDPGAKAAERKAAERKADLVERAIHLAENDETVFIEQLLAPRNRRSGWAMRLLAIRLQNEPEAKARLREEVSKLEACSLKCLLGKTVQNHQSSKRQEALSPPKPPAPPLSERTERELVLALSGWPRTP